MTPPAPPPVSVIVPVRNEEASIRELLQALCAQTHRPAEIVIADSGSSDRTKDVVRAFQAECPVPIVLVESRAAMPGRARNLAIARAANDWLACIDAGVVPAPDWLARLLAAAAREPRVDVVYGRLAPAPDTYFTTCAGIVYAPPDDRARWLPSSLFRRSAWAAAGGFREDLRSSEDLLFFRALERAGARETYSGDARVLWHLRPDIGQTFRRFATYSLNNMRAGLGRQWQAGVARLYLVLASLLVIGAWVPVAWALPPFLLVLRAERRIWRWYRATAPRRAWRETLSPRRVLTVAWIGVVIDVATFYGLWRWAAYNRDRRDGDDHGRMSIVYVSYDGALEPLGESQIIAYLERLSPRHAITLLSFEKPRDLADAGRVEALRRRLAAAGIRWRPLRYHKQPPVLSTLWDVTRAIVVAIRVARSEGAHIIHARSYVAACVALAARRATGARFLFDMRGLWPDEKVDAGHWRVGSPLYRLTKRFERRFFESADAIVSLTNVGVEAVRGAGYVIPPETPIEIITTCADLQRFSPGPRDAALAARLGLGGGPVVGCVGTLTNRYLRQPMLEYLACLTDAFRDLDVLVVTRDDHASIRRDAVAAGVRSDRLRITRAAFSDMPAHLRLMDVGMFFIEPTFSKMGMAATKLGEFLGTGVPVIINDGVGDSGRIVRDSAVGIVLADVTRETFAASLPTVGRLLTDADARRRCRVTAERLFDLDEGVQRYARLYARLGTPTRGEA